MGQYMIFKYERNGNQWKLEFEFNFYIKFEKVNDNPLWLDTL